jgi:bifunctional non-homologous end joining protein LigD
VPPKRSELPSRYEPALATLVKEPPQGDGWLHEIKFDGYRFGFRIAGGKAKLLTRRGHDWTSRLPHIASKAAKLRVDQALLDGEVAVVLPDGKTSFHGLQEALAGTKAGKKLVMVYFAFDLMFLDGRDLSKLGTEERKAELKRLLSGVPADSVIKYSDHVIGSGAAFFANAKKLGLEGIVSKRRGAAYRSGRTTDWLKTKATHRQEFVICGFILREGTSGQVGSLILAVRSKPGPKGEWVFAGQVGTGFTQDFARRLYSQLARSETTHSPFPGGPPDLTSGR